MVHKAITIDGLTIHNVPHELGKMSFGTVLDVTIIKDRMKSTGVKVADYMVIKKQFNKKEMA